MPNFGECRNNAIRLFCLDYDKIKRWTTVYITGIAIACVHWCPVDGRYL